MQEMLMSLGMAPPLPDEGGYGAPPPLPEAGYGYVPSASDVGAPPPPS
jgi:hypothetical protein